MGVDLLLGCGCILRIRATHRLHGAKAGVVDGLGLGGGNSGDLLQEGEHPLLVHILAGMFVREAKGMANFMERMVEEGRSTTGGIPEANGAVVVVTQMQIEQALASQVARIRRPRPATASLAERAALAGDGGELVENIDEAAVSRIRNHDADVSRELVLAGGAFVAAGVLVLKADVAGLLELGQDRLDRLHPVRAAGGGITGEANAGRAGLAAGFPPKGSPCCR